MSTPRTPPGTSPSVDGTSTGRWPTSTSRIATARTPSSDGSCPTCGGPPGHHGGALMTGVPAVSHGPLLVAWRGSGAAVGRGVGWVRVPHCCRCPDGQRTVAAPRPWNRRRSRHPRRPVGCSGARSRSAARSASSRRLRPARFAGTRRTTRPPPGPDGLSPCSTGGTPDPDLHRGALADGVRLTAQGGRADRVPPGADAVAVRRHRRSGAGGDRCGADPERSDAPETRHAELARRFDVAVHASLYEAPGDGEPETRLEHGDLRVTRRSPPRPHTQAPASPGRRGTGKTCTFTHGDTGYPVDGRRRPRQLPPAPTGGSPSSPTPTRSPAPRVRVPRRDRLGARPPRVRHAAAVGAGHHRQRHRERALHGGGEPHRHREPLAGTSITFYGSSFISDPYGRVLVQAPTTSRRPRRRSRPRRPAPPGSPCSRS